MSPRDHAPENPIHGNVEGILSQNAPLSNASFHLEPLTQFTLTPDTADRLGIQPAKQSDLLFNTIFVSSHMYPENPEGTQVIVGSMNMG